MQFCAVTAALVIGSVAERGRVIPAMVFIFFWATLVYCPVACWAWNVNGWGFKYGVLDYAGGGPVEIGSGMSAMAYSWVLGRRNEKMMLNFRPHNISLITLGTVFLWFGWLGFNGGSAFGANLRAAMACWNSCLTAMFAAMSWCLLDFRLAKKWSLVGWCSGTISGLVAATPCSGIITPWASIALGVAAGVICNYSTKFKFLVGIDDALDVFAEHTVGGIVGLIFNAFFAADYIIGLDGVNTGVVTGGFLNQNYRLLYVQVAYIVACCAYMFVVSAIIAKAIDMIPGLKLRASSEAELLGMDDDQHGEFAYDYVEVCNLPSKHLYHKIANTSFRFAVTTLRGHLPTMSRSRMVLSSFLNMVSQSTKTWLGRHLQHPRELIPRRRVPRRLSERFYKKRGLPCLNRRSLVFARRKVELCSQVYTKARGPETWKGQATAHHPVHFILFLSLSFILVVLVVALYPVEVAPDL